MRGQYVPTHIALFRSANANIVDYEAPTAYQIVPFFVLVIYLEKVVNAVQYVGSLIQPKGSCTGVARTLRIA